MKKTLITVITIVAIGIGYYFGKTVTDGLFESNHEAELMGALENAAASINETTPAMVDDSTRLDGAEAGPGNQLIYNYTLIGLESDQIDQSIWEKEMVPMIRKNISEAEGMRYLFEIGTTAIYRYHDSRGVLIDEIKVLASEVIKE